MVVSTEFRDFLSKVLKGAGPFALFLYLTAFALLATFGLALVSPICIITYRWISQEALGFADLTIAIAMFVSFVVSLAFFGLVFGKANKTLDAFFMRWANIR